MRVFPAFEAAHYNSLIFGEHLTEDHRSLANVPRDFAQKMSNVEVMFRSKVNFRSEGYPDSLSIENQACLYH